MFKDRPFASGFIWFVSILAGGTLLSFIVAVAQGHIIGVGVRENNPTDPLDLLPFLVLGFIFIGFVGSALFGLLVASLIYLTKRNEIADRKVEARGSE